MNELFLNVFNAGIMAAWAILAVLVLRILLHRAPAWIKCALWGIVGLRLVWPFRIESPVSLVPSTQTLPATQLYDDTPELNTGINALDQAVNPGFSQTFEAEISNSVNPLQIAVTVAGWIWFTGMVVMAVYALVSYLRLRRRVAVRMPVEGNVYLCDRIPTPFILGIIKPKIYLSSDFPEDQWPQILAHENAHLKRRDHWWKPLGFVLLTVHWFNPLLWVAYILLCRDIERACDETVIAALSTEEKKTYSETLLACSTGKPRIAACPLAFGETGVKQRIKAVLHYKKPALWILIAAVLICAVTAVCFLTQPNMDIVLRHPEYIHKGPGKGLEVYVWEENGLIRCGLLPGTNRSKTQEEIETLTPVALETMNIILDGYEIPRDSVSVFLVGDSIYWEEGTRNGTVYHDICRRLGVYDCNLDYEMFRRSGGRVLNLTINGEPFSYQRKEQGSGDHYQEEWLMNFEIYKKLVGKTWRSYWQVFSVKDAPDFEVLVLAEAEGSTWIYERVE